MYYWLASGACYERKPHLLLNIRERGWLSFSLSIKIPGEERLTAFGTYYGTFTLELGCPFYEKGLSCVGLSMNFSKEL